MFLLNSILCCVSLTLFYFYPHEEPLSNLKWFLMTNGVVSGAVFFAMIWHDYRKRRILHPIHLFYFSLVLMLGFGGFYTGLIMGTEFEVNLDIAGHIPTLFFTRGALIIQIGAFAFLSGFYLGDIKRKRIMRFHSVFFFPSFRLMFAFLFAAWLIAALSRFGVQSFGVLNAYIIYIPKAILFISALAFLESHRKRKSALFLGFVAGIELMFVYAAKMREEQLLVFLPIALAMAVSGSLRWAVWKQNLKEFWYGNRHGLRRRKKGKVGISVAIAFVISFMLFVFFPAASAVKQGEHKHIFSALAARITSGSSHDSTQKARGQEQHFILQDLAARMAVIISSASLCVEFRESGDPFEKDPVQLILAGFIPRVIWPDKPVIAIGSWFNQFLLEKAGRYNQALESRTSMALSAQGELFWAYGMAGMISLMALLGFFLAHIINYFYTNDLRKIPAVTYFIIVSIFLVKGMESTYSFAVSFLMLSAVISWTISKILGGRRSSAAYRQTPLPKEVL